MEARQPIQRRQRPAVRRPAPAAAQRDLQNRLRQWLLNAVRSEDVSSAAAIFFGSRLALFLLVFLFIGLFPIAPASKPTFLQAFGQWDGGWYLSIANEGYRWLGSDQQSNVAFFPLYPILGKIVGLIVGNTTLGLFLVSNLAFAVAIYYLYRLVKRDFDAPSAERTILYLALFPLSFIFSSLYTESLSLALAVAAFYYAREDRWGLAIVLGFFTALTRLAGLAIVVPLAYEYYRQRGLRPGFLSLAAVPAGTASFAAYLWALSGNALAFAEAEQAWGRHFTAPWETLSLSFRMATSVPFKEYVAAIALLDFAVILIFLVLTALAVRYLPPAYWLYASVAFLLAISSTIDPHQGLPTASISRYLMLIFPGFVLLGLAGGKRFLHWTLVGVFAVLLGPLAIYFFSGIWVV